MCDFQKLQVQFVLFLEGKLLNRMKIFVTPILDQLFKRISWKLGWMHTGQISSTFQ